MPIYAYRCASCGHSRDVLQKMSDPVLTVCPACGADQFQKQVTAAGFQLKGSGWYVTDFRNNNGGAGSSASAPAASPAPAPAEGGAASPAPAPAPAAGESGSGAAAGPAASCGGGCACH
jgi:putative FmdB family regulatory protein